MPEENSTAETPATPQIVSSNLLSELVPVTMSESWGPVCCMGCNQDKAFTIWVTPEEKETLPFKTIYEFKGIARCEECGPPSS